MRSKSLLTIGSILIATVLGIATPSEAVNRCMFCDEKLVVSLFDCLIERIIKSPYFANLPPSTMEEMKIGMISASKAMKVNKPAMIDTAMKGSLTFEMAGIINLYENPYPLIEPMKKIIVSCYPIRDKAFLDNAGKLMKVALDEITAEQPKVQLEKTYPDGKNVQYASQDTGTFQQQATVLNTDTKNFQQNVAKNQQNEVSSMEQKSVQPENIPQQKEYISTSDLSSDRRINQMNAFPFNKQKSSQLDSVTLKKEDISAVNDNFFNPSQKNYEFLSKKQLTQKQVVPQDPNAKAFPNSYTSYETDLTNQQSSNQNSYLYQAQQNQPFDYMNIYRQQYNPGNAQNSYYTNKGLIPNIGNSQQYPGYYATNQGPNGQYLNDDYFKNQFYLSNRDANTASALGYNIPQVNKDQSQTVPTSNKSQIQKPLFDTKQQNGNEAASAAAVADDSGSAGANSSTDSSEKTAKNDDALKFAKTCYTVIYNTDLFKSVFHEFTTKDQALSIMNYMLPEALRKCKYAENVIQEITKTTPLLIKQQLPEGSPTVKYAIEIIKMLTLKFFSKKLITNNPVPQAKDLAEGMLNSLKKIEQLSTLQNNPSSSPAAQQKLPTNPVTNLNGYPNNPNNYPMYPNYNPNNPKNYPAYQNYNPNNPNYNPNNQNDFPQSEIQNQQKNQNIKDDGYQLLKDNLKQYDEKSKKDYQSYINANNNVGDEVAYNAGDADATKSGASGPNSISPAVTGTDSSRINGPNSATITNNNDCDNGDCDGTDDGDCDEDDDGCDPGCDDDDDDCDYPDYNDKSNTPVPNQQLITKPTYLIDQQNPTSLDAGKQNNNAAPLTSETPKGIVLPQDPNKQVNYDTPALLLEKISDKKNSSLNKNIQAINDTTSKDTIKKIIKLILSCMENNKFDNRKFAKGLAEILNEIKKTNKSKNAKDILFTTTIAACVKMITELNMKIKKGNNQQPQQITEPVQPKPNISEQNIKQSYEAVQTNANSKSVTQNQPVYNSDVDNTDPKKSMVYPPKNPMIQESPKPQEKPIFMNPPSQQTISNGPQNDAQIKNGNLYNRPLQSKPYPFSQMNNNGNPAQNTFKPLIPGNPAQNTFKPLISGNPAQNTFKPLISGNPAQNTFKPLISGNPAQNTFKPLIPGQVNPDQGNRNLNEKYFPISPAVNSLAGTPNLQMIQNPFASQFNSPTFKQAGVNNLNGMQNLNSLSNLQQSSTGIQNLAQSQNQGNQAQLNNMNYQNFMQTANKGNWLIPQQNNMNTPNIMQSGNQGFGEVATENLGNSGPNRFLGYSGFSQPNAVNAQNFMETGSRSFDPRNQGTVTTGNQGIIPGIQGKPNQVGNFPQSFYPPPGTKK